MMKSFNSKKADLSVTLLVFLTLVLVGVALFTFMTQQNRVEAKIANINVVSDFYNKQEVFERFVYAAVEGSVKATINVNKIKESTREVDVVTMKKDFLSEFQTSFLVENRGTFVPEYGAQEYKSQFRKDESYILEIDLDKKLFIFQFKDFILEYKPGLDIKNNQEIGYISYTKDFYFEIPIDIEVVKG